LRVRRRKTEIGQLVVEQKTIDHLARQQFLNK